MGDPRKPPSGWRNDPPPGAAPPGWRNDPPPGAAPAEAAPTPVEEDAGPRIMLPTGQGGQPTREDVRALATAAMQQDAARREQEQPSFLRFEANQPSRPLEAVGSGALQGATFNFADEIEAGVRAPFSDESYEQIRNRRRRENESLRRSDPGAYLAGEVGGGMATSALVPGAGALGVGGRLALAAGQGALAGAGAAEGADDMASSVAAGGAAGLLGGGLGEGFSAGARVLGNRLAPVMDDVADLWRARVLGRGVDAATEPGGEAAFGRWMRQRGIGDEITSTPLSVYRQTQDVLKRAGQEFDDIHSTMAARGQAVQPPLQSVLDADALIGKSVPHGENTRSALAGLESALQRNADPIVSPEAGRGMTFRQAHDVRQMLDTKIPRQGESTSEIRDREAIRTAFSRAMDEAADAANLGKRWRAANREYSMATRASGASGDAANAVANQSSDALTRNIGRAALIGALPGAAAVSVNNNRVDNRTTAGAGVGGALGAVLATALARGHGARGMEALVRGASNSAVLGSKGLEALAERAAGGAAASSYVRDVLRDAMESGEDPAVTNFKAAADPLWRQATVEDEE